MKTAQYCYKWTHAVTLYFVPFAKIISGKGRKTPVSFVNFWGICTWRRVLLRAYTLSTLKEPVQESLVCLFNTPHNSCSSFRKRNK